MAEFKPRIKLDKKEVRKGESVDVKTLVSHIMVRPFVEAYRIVADVLANATSRQPTEEDRGSESRDEERDAIVRERQDIVAITA